jgi:NitT/TauT family transport system permease protein
MSGSEPDTPARRGAASPWRRVLGIQVGLVAVLLVAWELVIAAGLATEFFFGRPTWMFAWVARGFLEGWLWEHTWVTLAETLAGFVLGTVIGTAIGLALWWSTFLSRVLSPVAVILNATPKIVMAPIFIVWFGIGLSSKVVLAVTICAIVAWISAFDAIRSVDLDLVDMIRALGGRRWDAFVNVVIPSSLTWIGAAMKINIGLALIGAITGEYLSSTHGLGYLAVKTASEYQMSQTLGVLLVIAVLAGAQYYGLLWAERRLLRWARQDELEFIT